MLQGTHTQITLYKDSCPWTVCLWNRQFPLRLVPEATGLADASTIKKKTPVL